MTAGKKKRWTAGRKKEAVLRLLRGEKVDTLRHEDRLTPGLIFRDPYVLEFLNLNDHYLEKDLYLLIGDRP